MDVDDEKFIQEWIDEVEKYREEHKDDYLKELRDISIGGAILTIAFTVALALVGLCSPPAEAGLWQDIKDNYRQGRAEAADRKTTKHIEETVNQRYERLWREVMRKRIQQEKHLAEISRGFKNFMSKGHFKFYVIGGVALFLYLCEKGGAGCVYDWDKERDEDRRRAEKRKDRERAEKEKRDRDDDET